MDIKIAGITEEIMKQALAQAKAGRLHILGEMDKAMDGARAELGEYAPKIETIKIPVDKIREVIGTGGKVIREIVEKTGAKVDIDDDGTVKIAASDAGEDRGRQGLDQVDHLGAGSRRDLHRQGREGRRLRRLRELLRRQGRPGPRAARSPANASPRPSDVLSEGQTVKVKLLGFDDRGKTKLSMKVVDQETGEDLTDKINAERAERGEARPDRRHRRRRQEA